MIWTAFSKGFIYILAKSNVFSLKQYNMKKLLLILLLLPLQSFSQGKVLTKKVVQLIEPRQIFVNSALKPNGKTRVDIKIDLPPNTVEWYYSFTTTAALQANNNLHLFAQVSRLYDPSGTSAAVLSYLSVPDGFAPIDIFLINNQGKNLFYQTKALGGYLYNDPGGFEEGTVKNHRQGKIKIDDIRQGTFYLGIRNPSMNTGVNVMIEVVAVVEETSFTLTEWSQETKEENFTFCKDYFKSQGFDSKLSSMQFDDLAGCVMIKFTKKYTPEDMIKLASYEKKSLLLELSKSCDTELKTKLFTN